MRFNINSNIRVKLTKHGIDCFGDYHIRNGIILANLKTDSNGWTYFQAWEFMAWAGDYMCNGCPNLIKECIIDVISYDPVPEGEYDEKGQKT